MSSFYESCIYHIKHSEQLERLYDEGGVGVIEEKGSWKGAREFLLAARKSQQPLLIFFDHAEAFVGIGWAAQVDDIRVQVDEDGRSTTRVHLRALRRFPRPAARTALRVLSTGEALDPNHQRGYVLCATPRDLAAQFLTLNGGPEPVTIFSFGYWGWGNATVQLVEMIDQAEAHAGYEPPLFVDVRLKRACRAVEFKDEAFAKATGPGRYRWEPRLGNQAIDDDESSERVVIKDPTAAEDLFEQAIKAADERRRVIFFCACETPSECHRHVVAKLLSKAAARRGVPLRVVEWPGGDARAEVRQETDEVIRKVARGQKRISLPEGCTPATAFPWYTPLRLQGESQAIHVLTGPAYYSKGWCLQVLDEVDAAASSERVLKRAVRLRKTLGYDPIH